MSGLAAIMHRDNRPVDGDAISAMLLAAPYRGPDGMYIQIWQSVALGHAKMAMTREEDDERQPLISPRSGCAVVADARLDNRADLLTRLPDGVSQACSDADLILRAYERWGTEVSAHLLGDFAFVIWDPREHRAVCGRDTSGQRNLFYRIDQRTFAAASEIQQLLQDQSVPIAANEERIRESLVPLNVFRNEQDNAATYFQGICALAAGHTLVVTPDTDHLHRYWELTLPQEIRYRTDDEYADHFRTLFFDVVAAHLRTSRPVTMLLSGGLDSSSIACTAQQLYRSGRATDYGFATVTSEFEGMPCDERPFVEDIGARYGFTPQFTTFGNYGGRLNLTPGEFAEAPNMGIAEARTAVYSAATQGGARTLLTGDVADSCLYGTRHVLDSLLRHGNLPAFRRHLRAYRRVSDERLRKTVALYCLAPLLPLTLHKRLTTTYIEKLIRENQAHLLPHWMPDMLRGELGERHLQLSVREERARLFSNDVREVERRLLYPPEVVRSPAPWSLEIRRPFADRRLHEFMLAIPPEQNFEPHPETDEFYAGAKQILRRSMRGILPESIRTRTTKTIFNAVFQQEIALQWPLYEAAFGPSRTSEIAAGGYVDASRFWQRLQTLHEGTQGLDTVYIMQLVDLETWLRGLRTSRSALATTPNAVDASYRNPIVLEMTKS